MAIPASAYKGAGRDNRSRRKYEREKAQHEAALERLEKKKKDVAPVKSTVSRVVCPECGRLNTRLHRVDRTHINCGGCSNLIELPKPSMVKRFRKRLQKLVSQGFLPTFFERKQQL